MVPQAYVVQYLLPILVLTQIIASELQYLKNISDIVVSQRKNKKKKPLNGVIIIIDMYIFL